MNSIRHQLFVGLVSLLTVVGVVAGLGMYATAFQAANTVFDYHLKQLAFALHDHAATAMEVSGSDDDDAAHALRTPLAAVSLQSQLLAHADGDTARHETLTVL